MRQALLGFFSGFPGRRFPKEIAERLREALAERESIVFVSAWPEDYERNDSAIFVSGSGVSSVGRIYWTDKGRQSPFVPEMLGQKTDRRTAKVKRLLMKS